MWGIRVNQLQLSSTADVDQLLFLDYQSFGPIVDYDKLKLFASICLEGISLEKNCIFHNKPKSDPDQLVRRILQSFYSNSQSLISNQGMTGRGPELCLPLPPPYIKLNVDAAIRDEYSVVAAVARYASRSM
ncbi:hypothetical protein TorRG33x02_207670 [Trema orientale]|uniref:Uncharacterized protein n=1 Tax=Trema orientale TaxID=63057 RepID=A0A2P5ED91_TREOI|nr:hypothetical protein TorRG33x02_207670 [Trema orientale]